MKTKKDLSKIKDKGLTITHTPVLLKEVISGLDIKKNDVVVDGTLGGGGHAKAISKLLGNEGIFIGLDVDQDAVDRAKRYLKDTVHKKILFTENFRNLDKVLLKTGISKVDKILFDLGWSMYQIEESGRGFSFRRDEPLLMTLKKDPDEEKDITARKIINEWSEESIANIIYGYGQDRFARRIAKNIIKARTAKEIKTTKELAEIIEKSVPHRFAKGKIHPATKTFQALRIAVNDELGALKEAMQKSILDIKAGGRIAIISFHSTEDRIVKEFFIEKEKEGVGKRITKKPIAPNEKELAENRRARSAKLRIFEKK